MIMNTFKKLTKAQAEKIFNAGEEIYLHTSLLSYNNAWQNPIPFNNDQDRPTHKDVKFQDLVNSFRFYNCDKERGMRVIYLQKTN